MRGVEHAEYPVGDRGIGLDGRNQLVRGRLALGEQVQQVQAGRFRRRDLALRQGLGLAEEVPGKEREPQRPGQLLGLEAFHALGQKSQALGRQGRGRGGQTLDPARGVAQVQDDDVHQVEQGTVQREGFGLVQGQLEAVRAQGAQGAEVVGIGQVVVGDDRQHAARAQGLGHGGQRHRAGQMDQEFLLELVGFLAGRKALDDRDGGLHRV